MKILAAAILAFCVLTVPPAPVAADFEFVEEVFLSPPIPFDPYTSVVFDGKEFLLGRFDGSAVRFDASYNFIETFAFPAPFSGNLRSIDIDRANGNMLALSNSSRILTEFTPDFNVAQMYSAIQPDLTATAGVVLDPVTNTTWGAGVFTGLVTQYTREGGFLFEFQTEVFDAFNTIAIDWVNQTILLLDPAPDRLVEYTFDGEFVGTPFLAADDDFIGLGTGFPNGIYYDSETARLYVISSIGDLTIWEDLSRLGDTASETVVPDTITVFRGNQIDGALADAFKSDDSRLRFNLGFVISPVEAPVWLIFDGTLSNDSPSSLQLTAESQAGTPGLTGTFEAWNWNSSAYEVIDVSTASFNSDTVVTVDISSGISNYVQPGSGAVRSRIGWRRTGFTINFPWEVRLDQMVWTVE